MNGMPDTAADLAADVSARAKAGQGLPRILLCPPTALLSGVSSAISDGPVMLGAQDCHKNTNGAHTGDTSAELLAAIGCRFVIVGHSERRADHRETSDDVKQKAQAALNVGLTPIICVGETREERDAGKTGDVISKQVADSLPESSTSETIVIAYEPVWAIGTGLSATENDIADAHAEIRRTFAKKHETADELTILYGGSVKGANAKAILSTPGVSGALVGGASLKADEFWSIIQACPQ